MTKSLENTRILIFLRSFQLGGSERQAILLANYLKHSLKADVQVWTFNSEGRAADILEKQKIPTHRHSPKWEGNFFKKITGLIGLIKDIRKFKPHVILPFTDYPNKICGAVWRFTGAKCCIWNQRDEGREITTKPLEKMALRMTSLFVSNSIEGKRFLMNTFSIPEEKIHLIHNGIQLEEPEKQRSQWRKDLHIDEETFSAVMVANLQSFKDHPTLLEAWRRVIDKTDKKQVPILFLAGRFDETHSQLKFLINDLKLGNSVRFLGEVIDIPGLLNAVDLSVFSSKFEGCPNSVLESMAAGLPVVATHITGTAEALGDDYPFLAPINSPESFAEHILTFISDKNLRQKIGEQNYLRISILFKPERMFEAYKKLLITNVRLSHR